MQEQIKHEKKVEANVIKGCGFFASSFKKLLSILKEVENVCNNSVTVANESIQ